MRPCTNVGGSPRRVVLHEVLHATRATCCMQHSASRRRPSGTHRQLRHWRFSFARAPTCRRAISRKFAGSRDGVVVRRGKRPHGRASGRLVDTSVETARPPGIAVALYRSSMDTNPPDTAQLVPALEQALGNLPSAAIPSLIGDLERLQALLAVRLLREAWQSAPSARAASALEDLQHLTPAQVAELLNLTEPYVHELCRTGRLQATKAGKYWMIPVAGLREWLVYPKRDVDDGGPRPVESPHPGGHVGPTRLVGPAGRPRRSPMI